LELPHTKWVKENSMGKAKVILSQSLRNSP
jgi:hypothetical protein